MSNNFLKTHVIEAKYLLEVINKKQEHYVSEGLIILGKGPVIKSSVLFHTNCYTTADEVPVFLLDVKQD